jgi:hypothetical protein
MRAGTDEELGDMEGKGCHGYVRIDSSVKIILIHRVVILRFQTEAVIPNLVILVRPPGRHHRGM